LYGAEIAKYEDTDEDNIIGKLNLPNSPQTDGDKDQNDGKDGRSNNVHLRFIDHMPHKKGHSNNHEQGKGKRSISAYTFCDNVAEGARNQKQVKIDKSEEYLPRSG
jgi:hypothetical protein